MSLTPDMSHYTEVLPDGLHRLRLTSPSGLTVNAWLVRAPSGWLLVDTGFTYTTGALIEQLAALGLTLDDIDAAIYTHTHEDHMGGGVVLDQQLSRRHVIAAGTEPAQTNYFAWYDNLESWVGWMERTLPESPIRDVIIQFRRGRTIAPWRTGGTGLLTDPRWVQPGDTVQLSGFTWTCIPVPGHDPWHVAWYLHELHWLFVGDVLLGSPTPLVPPHLDQLGPYHESLFRLAALSLPVDLVLPGHGRAFTRLEQGVRDSIAHVDRVQLAIHRGWQDAAVLNPGLVAASLLNPERPDLRRGYVWLFNVFAQFDHWHRRGEVVLTDDLHWAKTASTPAYAPRTP